MLLGANRLQVSKRVLGLCAVAALVGMLIYIVALSHGYGPSVAWYWLLIGVIDGAIMLQILARLKQGDNGSGLPVLGQILALNLLLSLMVVWAAPHGLLDSDAQYNLGATRAVGIWGWPVPQAAGLAYSTTNYTLWPGMDFLNASITNVTGIMDLELARYLPLALGLLSILFLYIAGLRMFGSAHSALFAALGMSQITFLVRFQSEYVREAFAFPLLMGLMALTVGGRLDVKDRVLAVIVIIAIVIFHHLTSLMAVLLLAVTAAVYWAMGSGWLGFGNRTLRNYLKWNPNGRGLLALTAATLFMFYAINIGPSVIETIARAIHFLVIADIRPAPYVGRLRDFTQQYVYFGRMAVTLVMGATVVIYLVHRHLWLKAGPRWSQMELPLLLWIVLVGGWMLTANYGGALRGADPMRFLTFAFPPLLLLFAQVGMQGIYTSGFRSRALTGLTTVTVAVFLTVNLLGLPRYLYIDGALPNYRTGQISMVYGQELFAASSWQAEVIPDNVVLAGDHSAKAVFEGLTQTRVKRDPDFFESGGSSANYGGFIIRSEMSRNANFGLLGGERVAFPLSEQSLRSLMNLPNYHLAYDNGVTQLLYRSDRGAGARPQDSGLGR